MPIRVVTLDCRQLRADDDGFTRIGKLHSELNDFYNDEIHIDFQQVSWIDAHLCASMMIVIEKCKLKGNILKAANLREETRLILRKAHLLKKHAEDKHNTVMPVTPFGNNAGTDFSNYTKKYLARREMPKMTAPLKGKFFESLDELFANCSLHSKSDTKICVGGQFYPAQKRLTFTIADGGIGMQGALLSASRKRLSAHLAIDWAMTPYNTTRQLDIPGGLGSKLLREFIALNGGRLIVSSNDGYWCQTGSDVSMRPISDEIPGTTVIIEINTSDKNLYDFESPPDPNDIW